MSVLDSVRQWLRDARDYAADILRGRGRGKGQHVRPAGEKADLSYDLPCMRPGSYSSAPDSPLAFRSFGDPNLGAAALSVPLEMHHPKNVSGAAAGTGPRALPSAMGAGLAVRLGDPAYQEAAPETQTRVRPLPVPPLASERPDTPSRSGWMQDGPGTFHSHPGTGCPVCPDTPASEQTGNWHQRPIEDTSLDMPKWLMRLLFCDHAAIAAELERDRERFAAKGMAA